ncbi:MAG: hypothetical protein HYT30_01720 [Parcubacteria group bacterium]|nr:hypothetical protein [Parcubacteria group bacterium]
MQEKNKRGATAGKSTRVEMVITTFALFAFAWWYGSKGSAMETVADLLFIAGGVILASLGFLCLWFLWREVTSCASSKEKENNNG